MTFKVGDRVRCINATDFNGKEGTVDYVSAHARGLVGVKWDDLTGVPGYLGNGGTWRTDSIELISQDKQLQDQIDALTEKYAAALKVKDEALLIASTAFYQYADNHFAKETPEATIKALQNSALAKLMNDALEAD